MFVGTSCPKIDTPNQRRLDSAAFCTECDGSSTAAPTSSPPSLTDVFTGQAFTSSAELLNAVDEYMLDSSSDSIVAMQYGYPIGNWDVSRISDFSQVFDAQRNPDMLLFDADLSGWDVSSAETMNAMFQATVAFTDSTNSLAGWNVANVADMSSMFAESKFAGDVSQWQVGKVRDFSFFAEFAVSFQSDVSKWDVGAAEDMGWMFRGCSLFISDLSAWDVSKVGDFTNM